MDCNEDDEQMAELHCDHISSEELCDGGDDKNKAKADEEKGHECNICNKKFGCGKALGGHMRAHLLPKKAKINDNTSTENNIVRCKVCEKAFPSHKSLYGHMRTHSNRVGPSSSATTTDALKHLSSVIGEDVDEDTFNAATTLMLMSRSRVSDGDVDDVRTAEMVVNEEERGRKPKLVIKLSMMKVKKDGMPNHKDQNNEASSSVPQDFDLNELPHDAMLEDK